MSGRAAGPLRIQPQAHSRPRLLRLSLRMSGGHGSEQRVPGPEKREGSHHHGLRRQQHGHQGHGPHPQQAARALDLITSLPPPAPTSVSTPASSSHPPTSSSAASVGVWPSEAAASMLAASLLGLSCVACDVFAPGSLHLLQPLDVATHSWVLEHVPPEFKSFAAGKLLSDAGIVLGMLGWGYAAVCAVGRADGATTQALGLAVAAYGLVGAFKHGDSLLVAVLKSAFARERPAWVHATPSFPSGHTTAGVFIVGTLLFLLLPVLFEQEAWRAQQGQQGQQGQQAQRGQQGQWGESQPQAVVVAAPARDATGGWAPEQQGQQLPPQQQQQEQLTGGSYQAGAHFEAAEVLAHLAAEAAGGASQPSPGSSMIHGSVPTSSSLQPWQQALLRRRWALWGAALAATGAGRLLADAHWSSDVLAGACLGAALTSSTVLLWHSLVALEGE